MPLTWLVSWAAAHWKGIAAVVLVAALFGGLYGLGRSHASAAWEARWEAREAELADAAAQAQARADATLARQTAATREAARRFADAQTDNARLAGVNRDLDRRLRDALRRDAVPAPAPDPAGTEPPGVRLDAATVALALSGFSRECAERADGLRDQVNALIEAWPR